MRRATKVVVLLLALLPGAWIAWLARDAPHFGHFHDDGLYWVTAKSLAQGTGYRTISLPDRPFQTKYPPVYPLLVAGVWKLFPNFPENLAIGVALNWLPIPFCLLLGWRLFREFGLGEKPALVAGAALALNIQVIRYSITMTADLLAVCLLMAALLLISEASRPERGAWLTLAAGGLAGICYLTRSVMLPLAMAGPLWFLLRKQRFRAGLFLVGMLPALAGWQWWVRTHMGPAWDVVDLYYADYVAYHRAVIGLRDLPLLIWKNAMAMPESTGGLLLFRWSDDLLPRCAVYAMAAISVLGVVRLARRTGLTPAHLFAAGYLCMLAPWNFPPTERFMLPLLPLVLAGFAAEAERIFRPGTPRVAPLGLVALCGVAVCVNFVVLAFLPGLIAQWRREGDKQRVAYSWIARSLPPNARLLAFRDPVLYLYTGRAGMRLQVSSLTFYRPDYGDEALKLVLHPAGFARRHQLGYLLQTPVDYKGDLSDEVCRRIARVSAESPEFRPLYRSGEIAVYQIQ